MSEMEFFAILESYQPRSMWGNPVPYGDQEEGSPEYWRYVEEEDALKRKLLREVGSWSFPTKEVLEVLYTTL